MLLKLWVSKCHFSFPFAAWSILKHNNYIDMTSAGFFQNVKGCIFLFACGFNPFLSTLLVTMPFWLKDKWGLHADFVLHKIIQVVFFPIIFTFVWQICQFITGTKLWPLSFLSCSLLAYSLPFCLSVYTSKYHFDVTLNPTVLKCANQPCTSKNMLKHMPCNSIFLFLRAH